MAQFSVYMSELLESKSSHLIAPFMSQYTFYLIIACIVVVCVFIYACKKIQLVPKGFWAGGVEHLVSWARQDVGYNTIGPTAEKHIPFLLTILFFVLVANLIGLIPGAESATGVMGTTFAIALFSFVYFNYYGFKTKGFKKYMKSFAPEGLPLPLALVIALIEMFSTIIRLFTLAIRLFANMYAGHLVLGAFSILTSVFVLPLAQGLTLAAFTGALPSLLWLVFLVLMYVIELMMACIQAYVFAMLSAVYVQLAIQDE